jgi:putative ABC transport system permease protein
VLNSISISTNWINERRYEIGVRKAFGHSHFNIFKMLYSEMLSIFIISGIIASLLYIFLIQLLQNSILRSLSFGIEIFIVSIIMIFVTSFITSLIPVIKTFSIEPKEAMQV